jgi:hypothetical protein
LKRFVGAGVRCDQAGVVRVAKPDGHANNDAGRRYTSLWGVTFWILVDLTGDYCLEIDKANGGGLVVRLSPVHLFYLSPISRSVADGSPATGYLVCLSVVVRPGRADIR